ncbi:glutathionylspermidine synthase family protein [Sphingomonas sp. IC4-52]|uniref:glutathionylspermidine synthase family protein n=1 Tax=Sphingomonas sp. IC4-52 TaxID=2887202 RepID=UPI001D0F7670|nr:glutathionylspermidine synthase family protein [Sphingomonas sp. IC4-52]MCC2979519.1 glutathionylspermidine synthase family protein [Sphingomonas sp. IC4-52]
MKRRNIDPRPDWRERVERMGLIWHSNGAEPYWDESRYYALNAAEVARIERATETAYALLLEAGERVVNDPVLMKHFGIPEYCHGAVRHAWYSEPPALNFGRFDFGLDPQGTPKLFEFNCDTPTSMIEAAVVQWEWKEQCFPHLDQLNSLHERLIERWRELRPRLTGNRLWFTHDADPSHEDTITTTYLRDLAEEAGIVTQAILINDIGVDAHGRIVDLDDQLISAIFKLYPWEWIVDETYGPDIVRHLSETAWIEPIWKMIWSNKAILEVLWQMFPGHPNLLAASSDRRAIGDSYVAKPFLAREGANIEIVEDDAVVARSGGKYVDGKTLYQQRCYTPDFDGHYPVLGAWIVDGAAAGLGIREDGLITGNGARFVPHVIVDDGD